MATILVVDDDEAVRDSMRAVLERVDHQVILAEDGDAAVRRYSLGRPDMVITDLLLPDKDGIEIVREIRRIDPKARIIAMSGGDETTELRLRTLTTEFGDVELLPKPFRFAQLIDAIERALKASR